MTEAVFVGRAHSTTGTERPFQPCPVTPVVDIVFSRWTTPILWSLHHDGPLRFTQIRDRLGTVTAKVLTQRLRQLERDGMIVRQQFLEVPPRVEYTITELGLSLSPAFQFLGTWAADNMSSVVAARSEYDSSGRPRPA